MTMRIHHVIRHPEVAAERPAKGDGIDIGLADIDILEAQVGQARLATAAHPSRPAHAPSSEMRFFACAGTSG